MLTITAAVMLFLWIASFILLPSMGGFVHVFLLAAAVLALARIIEAESPLA